MQLYKDYSNHPLLVLINRELQSSSVLRIFGAGLPALMLNRGTFRHHIFICPTSHPFQRSATSPTS